MSAWTFCSSYNYSNLQNPSECISNLQVLNIIKIYIYCVNQLSIRNCRKDTTLYISNIYSHKIKRFYYYSNTCIMCFNIMW
jgi:hypothetical protein